MKQFINITPDKYRCAGGPSCPAIFKTNDDTYYIVGTTLKAKDVGLDDKVADYETAIEIPAALLEAAIEGVLKQRTIAE